MGMDTDTLETGAFMVADMLYSSIFRKLLQDAVLDPEKHMYDERLMAAMDAFFKYGGK